jgi:formate dehydrogenase maturation protein FdhE
VDRYSERRPSFSMSANPARSEVGDVSEHPVFQHCPRCGSMDVPTLVVRGSDPSREGVTLRCRDCGDEWSVQRAQQLRAS